MTSGTLGSLGGSSFLVQGAQGVFDVTKESDIIALLRLIHQNPIDPETKNHLRDLIFSYTQNKTPETHMQVVNACAALGITVATSGVVPASGMAQRQAPTVGRFNAGRPKPSFAVVNVAPIKTAPATTPALATPPIVPSAPEPTATEQKTEVTPSPTAVSRQTVGEVPQVAPLPKTVDLTAVQARISEIKRLVHEKVGNPVNLLETNNGIGREYMNALLDAMKKTNASGHGELEAAMARLESAVSAVLQTASVSPKTATVPVAETTAKPEQTEREVNVVPEKNTAAVNEAVRKLPVADVNAESARIAAQIAKLKAEQKNIESQSTARPETTPQRQSSRPSVAPVPEYSAPTPEVRSEHTTGLHSVAKDKQLQDLLRSNREKEILATEEKEKATIAAMDPLLTPPVTAGLSQLLSEWSLFKSSGFFGTGPSGKDHVLYQKISGLTMATVTAGRFEGATPLIKQSIADYMNGWRYEEGIIHEHGETFEHYLRKVVHHIISKKKLGAQRR